MIRRILGMAAVLTALTMSSALAQSAAVPVMVGGETQLDACGSNGRVRGLDPNGDNFLAVRAGPSSRASETDRLNEGDEVYVCDERGHWLGVVYGNGTCGVTTPIERRKAYRGGCRSGWVFGDFVDIYPG